MSIEDSLSIIFIKNKGNKQVSFLNCNGSELLLINKQNSLLLPYS